MYDTYSEKKKTAVIRRPGRAQLVQRKSDGCYFEASEPGYPDYSQLWTGPVWFFRRVVKLPDRWWRGEVPSGLHSTIMVQAMWWLMVLCSCREGPARNRTLLRKLRLPAVFAVSAFVGGYIAGRPPILLFTDFMDIGVGPTSDLASFFWHRLV